MNARSWITLAGVVVVVAGLGLLRGGQRPGSTPNEATPATVVSRPAILDFGRGQCVACKRMMPVLDSVREQHQGVVDVRYFDLAEPTGAARASEFEVRLIPTQVFVQADGAEVFRHEGFMPREAIERKLAELGWTSSR